MEHYSRFADGIPTRLRYALPVKAKSMAGGGSVATSVTNASSVALIDMERLLPAGVPQVEREPLQRVLMRQKMSINTGGGGGSSANNTGGKILVSWEENSLDEGVSEGELNAQ